MRFRGWLHVAAIGCVTATISVSAAQPAAPKPAGPPSPEGFGETSSSPLIDAV
jgi:hypothetical protein